MQVTVSKHMNYKISEMRLDLVMGFSSSIYKTKVIIIVLRNMLTNLGLHLGISFNWFNTKEYSKCRL